MKKNLNLKLIGLFLSTFSFLTTTTFLNNNKSYAMENNPTYQQSYDASKSEFQKQIESSKKILTETEADKFNQQAVDLTKFEERNYPGYYDRTFEKSLEDFERSLITRPSNIGKFIYRPENISNSNNISNAVKRLNKKIFYIKDKLKKIEKKVINKAEIKQEDCVTKQDLKELEIYLKDVLSFSGKYINEILKNKNDGNTTLSEMMLKSMTKTLLDSYYFAFMNENIYNESIAKIQIDLAKKTQAWFDEEFNLQNQDLKNKVSTLAKCAINLFNPESKEFKEYENLIKLIYNDFILYVLYIAQFMNEFNL